MLCLPEASCRPSFFPVAALKMQRGCLTEELMMEGLMKDQAETLPQSLQGS